MNIVRAAAVERSRRVQVMTTAKGRACRFDFSVHRWSIQGAVRQTEIARRVERELHDRGVRADFVVVRVA